MIELYECANPSMALKQLGQIAAKNEAANRKAAKRNEPVDSKETIVFCDSTLTLEAEKAICDAVGGTFDTAVYTFGNYLNRFAKPDNVLSRQGSAMVLRMKIDENREKLKLFGKLSAVDAVDSVYETISRFYASGIKSDDLKSAMESGAARGLSDDVLGKKLEDLCVIFSEYERYLEENGKKDRNGRLGELPGILRSDPELKCKDIVFFGYREFSETGKEILRAAMECAENVFGVFVGGERKLYSNAACKSFEDAARAAKTNVKPVPPDGIEDTTCDAAVSLADVIFDPSKRRDGFRVPADDRVFMYEAQDGAEEMEYIAAQIKKNTGDGHTRYRDIAVVIPDMEDAQRDVRKIFARYDIPCYVDVKHSLLSHPLYAFVKNFILCDNYGAAPSYVDDIVTSPYFPGDEDKKTAFRNYMAKYGKYKGAVYKEADEKFLMDRLGPKATDEEKEKARKTARDVNEIREVFVSAMNFFDSSGDMDVGKRAYEGTKALFESKSFNIEKTSDRLYSQYKENYLEEAQFLKQAPNALLAVLKEAADLGGGLDCRGFLKILKSGAYAKKMTLTPAKLDAVFVSDISRTLVMDKRVVFAARMTEGVPDFSQDTRFISDKDIDRLATLMPSLGPKNAQDNSIKRETVALNVSSFIDRLYLGYSVTINGTAHQKSEVFEYAYYAFSWNGNVEPGKYEDGIKEIVEKVSELEKKDAAYYCSELVPAIMWTERNKSDESADETCETVKGLLRERYGDEYEKMESEASAPEREIRPIASEYGRKLYGSKAEDNCFPPTTLEAYFGCPYRAFIEKGLKAGGRADDDTQGMDIGNLYHETFKEVADDYLDEEKCKKYGLREKEGFAKRAGDIAREKLEKGSYRFLVLTKRGNYDKERLIEEIVVVAREVFEQIRCSKFDIAEAETWCDYMLDDTYSIYGKVDRVDVTSESDGNMVRIIDYKTSGKKASCKEYYLGNDLQLPLYLLAESEKMSARPAGAFYLPARVVYSKKGENMILSGFSDGTADTGDALDDKSKSGGKKHIDAKCPREDSDEEKEESFDDFLEYGRLIALGAIREMSEGNIKPSPGVGACDRCDLKGCCGFELGRDGEERDPKVSDTVRFVVDAVRATRSAGDAGEDKEEK